MAEAKLDDKPGRTTRGVRVYLLRQTSGGKVAPTFLTKYLLDQFSQNSTNSTNRGAPAWPDPSGGLPPPEPRENNSHIPGVGCAYEGSLDHWV
jgi:hypothetical protein